jgi:hypothetical protein
MVIGMEDDIVREAGRIQPTHGAGCQRTFPHAAGRTDRDHRTRMEMLIQPGQFGFAVEEDIVLSRKKAERGRNVGRRPLLGIVVVMHLSINVPAACDDITVTGNIGADSPVALGDVLVSALVLESVVCHPPPPAVIMP